jgi:hypothetical protein
VDRHASLSLWANPRAFYSALSTTTDEDFAWSWPDDEVVNGQSTIQSMDWLATYPAPSSRGASVPIRAFSGEPDLIEVDRDHQFIPDREAIVIAAIGPAPDRKLDPVNLHDALDVLHRRKSSGHFDPVVVASSSSREATISTLPRDSTAAPSSLRETVIST